MKIHCVSLGCPRNWTDTETMMGFLKQKKHEFVPDESQADIVLVNTCGFLQEAREEALQVIEELVSSKKSSAKLIVTGCMVQKFSHLLKERFGCKIHYLLGAGDIDQIAAAVESPVSGEIITDKKSSLFSVHPRFYATPSHYAYVKIAEGCRKKCSYCLIPEIKGSLKSKESSAILAECKSLLEQGVKEIILIAQDLSDFGKDRMEKAALENLIKEILKIQKDFWLRLLYVYPDDISDELIALMASDTRICPYIDMPIQHINDDILKKMHRAASKEKIYNTIARLRHAMPDIAIRTSLIAGFPSETDEQFAELMEFVKRAKLDQVGIFAYSREEGTRAGCLEGQIAEEIKQQRVALLFSAQQKVVQKKHSGLLGKTCEVIIDGYHSDSNLLIQARSQKQAPNIDSVFIINDSGKVQRQGALHRVQVTKVVGHDLLARVMD